MKAAFRTQYGPPDVLDIREIETPQPKDNEVLIRVKAATVNRTDCGILWAKPFIMRFFTGLSEPKLKITGTDFAGTIEAAGKNVTMFKVGDNVFGFDDSGVQSHAEYMTYPQNKPMQTIPAGIRFEQAAAAAEGAHYAINFINKVQLKAGQKVMLNGATGAIGSAALQFLKQRGLYVTATCPGKNLQQIQDFGADKVIDYTQHDFTQDNEEYDFVFDAVGKSTFGKCRPLLKKGGVYISSELGPKVQNPILALITPLLGGKKVKFPVPLNIPASLVFIRDLLEQGKFKPLIDRTYKLEQIRDAYTYVDSGKKTGNVIISMD